MSALLEKVWDSGTGESHGARPFHYVRHLDNSSEFLVSISIGQERPFKIIIVNIWLTIFPHTNCFI